MQLSAINNEEEQKLPFASKNVNIYKINQNWNCGWSQPPKQAHFELEL
jgi:hypothetical protein